MKKRKLTLVISLIAIVIMIGGGAVHLYNKHKQEKLKRNREYEVSLVKALKNSYEGIEEIEIDKPHYESLPVSWSCNLTITFDDGEKISYGINHRLEDTHNYKGVMPGDSNKKIDNEWSRLKSHIGYTKDKVTVKYSNGEKGEQ